MFIHIGNDNAIRSGDVIAILDYNLISSSTIMENFMEGSEKEGKIIGPRADAKSVMVTRDHIYYSTLSVTTLKKRASMISTIDKLDDFSDDIKEIEM
nr:extracellular matrix/biofilm biosynthesis regulator RemA family protein [Virgibacillus sp. YIM 98842]